MWIEGIVVRGNGLGRKMGFPTANISLLSPEQRPEDGIYACLVRVHDKEYMGAMHAGPRPSVPDTSAIVEIHILDFPPADLYGSSISFYIRERIRDIQKFNTIQELRAAIHEDCKQVRHNFS